MRAIKFKARCSGASLRAAYEAQESRISAVLSDEELMAAFGVITGREDLRREDVAVLYDKIKGGRA